ncbi:MAG: iron-containing alcohol dehydrogenase [Chloroflexi bacterium]|nr:iron-containing alcohol dehydrogenase [Chloroflexota bacterium]
MDRLLDLQISGRLLFGSGALGELPAALSRLGARRPLIVTDAGLMRTGIPAQIIDLIQRDGLSAALFDGVEPDPRIAIVAAAAGAGRAHACDAVIGVGGGSALDIAKMTSVMLTNAGSPADYLGTDAVPLPGLPKVLIPTTAGTGSEVSPIAILSDEAAHLKKGVVSRHLYADVALVDPQLTQGLPPHITAYTGVDALTHAIEAYTNRFPHPLVDTLAIEAIRMIGRYLPRAVACGEDAEARYHMSLASTMGGLCLGTVNTGAVHALAYPLGGQFNIPHGIANSLLLPYVMRYNLIARVERFNRIAEALGSPIDGLAPRAAADRAVEAVERLCRDVGIVSRMRELDVPENAIEPMARAAMDVTRLLSINPRVVTLEAAREIYRQAY